MSQTETLLLFVLGFCAALFCVLLLGRGVFAMIGQWSGWRETRKQPAAIRSMQAERDTLKAEKAMLAQKTDASISDMKMRLAEQMAEVSRNRNRLLGVMQTVKERETTIAHLQSQLDDKASLVTSLHMQIEDNVKSINLAYAKLALRESEATVIQNPDEYSIPLQMMHEAEGIDTPEQHDDLVSLAETPRSNAPNSFEARFASIAAGSPLLGHLEPRTTDTPSNDEVDRSVSNVLSLADRVRNLRVETKKA